MLSFYKYVSGMVAGNAGRSEILDGDQFANVQLFSKVHVDGNARTPRLA